MMKRVFALMLVAVAAGMCFSSCSKEDDGIPTAAEAIVGDWKSYFGVEPDEKVRDEADVYTYFSFKADGTGYNIYYDGGRTDWKWDVMGDMLSTQPLSSGSRSMGYQIVRCKKDTVCLFRKTYYNAYIKLIRIRNCSLPES